MTSASMVTNLGARPRPTAFKLPAVDPAWLTNSPRAHVARAATYPSNVARARFSMRSAFLFASSEVSRVVEGEDAVELTVSQREETSALAY